VLSMGDVFDVKYMGIDKRTRKDRVSRKVLMDKPEGYSERPPRSNDRGRDDRRGGGRDSRDRKPRRD